MGKQMTPQRVINTAIIGYGNSGKNLHMPLIESLGSYNLCAIATRKKSRLKSIPSHCSHLSVDEVMAEPDIQLIIVATPNDSHFELAKQALTAGKHVVVEKPLALKSAQAKELTAIAKEKNLVLATFHNRLWDCDFLAIKALVNNQQLGKIHSYAARVDRFWPEVVDNWRNNKEYGGATWELAPNLVMQSLYLFGEPHSVFADISTQRIDADAPDSFYIRLNYHDNLCVELRSSSLVKHSGPRFVIHGDKGSYIKQGIDPQHSQLNNGILPDNKKYGKEAIEDWGSIYSASNANEEEALSPSPKGDYPLFYEKLHLAITAQSALPVDNDCAVEVVQIIEAAFDSNKHRKVIPLQFTATA